MRTKGGNIMYKKSNLQEPFLVLKGYLKISALSQGSLWTQDWTQQNKTKKQTSKQKTNKQTNKQTKQQQPGKIQIGQHSKIWNTY